jgi:hypothetical protein
MKPCSKLVAVLILLVAGAAATEPAMARGGGGGSGRGGGGHVGAAHAGGYSHGTGYHHGGGYGHGYGYRGVGAAFFLGVPLYGLGYYSAPYYSYPAYAYSYPPPVYVEQGYPQTATAAGQDWYFCAGSNAYYPYVTECPGGWQRVPAVPPPPR